MESKEYALEFDLKNNAYHFDNQSYKLEKNIIFGLKDNVLGSPSDASKIISNPISFKNNKIIFYPSGIISSGSIYLTDSNKSLIYSLTCSVATINYLRKYKYSFNDNKWILLN